DCIADAAHRRCEPALHFRELLFGASSAQRSFQRRRERALVEWFHDVAERLDRRRLLERRCVRMRREEDYRHVELLAEPPCDIDAGQRSFDLDVYQSQVRLHDAHVRECISRVIHDPAYLIAQLLEAHRQLLSHQALVLDDQNARNVHDACSCVIGKLIATIAPGPPPTESRPLSCRTRLRTMVMPSVRPVRKALSSNPPTPSSATSIQTPPSLQRRTLIASAPLVRPLNACLRALVINSFRIRLAGTARSM